jgi:hypothetical protein
MVQNILTAAVPLPAVILIVTQAVAMTWWWSGEFRDIDARVSLLERVEHDTSDHENRIIIIEQSYIALREGITEIKTLLRDQRAERSIGVKGFEKP